MTTKTKHLDKIVCYCFTDFLNCFYENLALKKQNLPLFTFNQARLKPKKSTKNHHQPTCKFQRNATILSLKILHDNNEIFHWKKMTTTTTTKHRLLWLQKRLATGNTLPTFPKTIYSSVLDPADGHRTKTGGQYGRPASMLACKAAVVGLD